MMVFFATKEKVVNHDITKISQEEREELKMKLEKMEEEENSPSITVMHNFEGENSSPNSDDHPTRGFSAIKSNESICHLMM
jgi:hypothetical protein